MYNVTKIGQCHTTMKAYPMKKLIELFLRGEITSDFSNIGYMTPESMSAVAMYPLLGLPIMPIIAYETSIQTMRVSDGRKRLAVYKMFLIDEFELKGLKGLFEDYNRCTFSKLHNGIGQLWEETRIPFFSVNDAFSGDREVLKDIITKSI